MPRSKRAMTAIGTVVVFALAGLLIWFATTAYGIYRKSPNTAGLFDTTQVGLAFFEDLRMGRREMAYQTMSSGYRTRQTFEQFCNFLEEAPLLSTHTFNNQIDAFGAIATPDQPRRSGRIRYLLRPARVPVADDKLDEAAKADPKTNPRKLDLTLHFVEEHGQWVIDQITFP
jgi:hypothetical protein